MWSGGKLEEKAVDRPGNYSLAFLRILTIIVAHDCVRLSATCAPVSEHCGVKSHASIYNQRLNRLEDTLLRRTGTMDTVKLEFVRLLLLPDCGSGYIARCELLL